MSRFASIASCALVAAKHIPLFETARPAKTFPLMASAKPVILAMRGEAARLVEEAKAGIVVLPENPQALSQPALMLATDSA